MNILDRSTLKEKFKAGYLPTEKDYQDLINSTLNLRDDRFFGLWKRGSKYCEGDVVIYGKSLYMLDLSTEVDEDNCPGDDGGAQGTASAKSGDEKMDKSTTETSEDCICSDCAPNEDQRWCLLELQMDDMDWEITLDETTGEVLYVYNVRAKIGMGTDNPITRLEVKGPHGSIQADPDNEEGPSVALHEVGQDINCHAKWTLGNKAEFVTDSLGFAFLRLAKVDEGAGNLEGAKTESTSLAEDPVLMLFASTNDEQEPLVGVGTNDPKGIFQVEDYDRGRLIVNPKQGAEDAAVLLVNTKLGANGHYMLEGINQEYAYWQTDASSGLRIIMGGDYDTLDENMGVGLTALAIDAQGNVGIGTETPRSKVDIVEAEMGSVRIDFQNDNVCLSTINERPSPQMPATYNGIGVDDDFGTFITDAPNGFVFKAGRPHGEFDNEVNINQGEKIAFITSEGKMGLRTPDVPEDYDFIVNGHQMSLTAYLETDGSRINTGARLDGADTLEKLQKLYPLRFQWKSSTNAADAGEQIGFNAQNIFEQFPELVRRSGTTKAVAYGNLTAPLVAAIKEQQRIIEEMKQRLTDLEEQLGGSGSKSSKKK
ncbi:MAG: tail fiber domain-containing protein [Bacteroidota bacterium]